jgi:hypothetical protein
MENQNRLELNELSFEITKKRDAVEIAISDRLENKKSSLLKNEDIDKMMNLSHVDMVQHELSKLIDDYEKERDLERINILKLGAKIEMDWHYHGPDNFDTKNSRIQRRWNQTLANRIEEAGLLIHKDKKNVSKYEKEVYPLCVVSSNESFGIVCSLWYYRMNMESNGMSNWKKTQKDGYIVGDHETGEDGETAFVAYINPYMPAGTILVCQEEDLTSKELSEDFVSICINVKGHR